VRMFVAVVPPEGVREGLQEFLAPRREAEQLRWTLPEQWHVTLAFLADVPDRAVDDLVERLGRAARKRSPMSAKIAGGGAFPHVGKAKVLFADLDTDREELSRAATGTRAAASRAGIAVDGQRFRPHVTLARMNRPIEATNWVRLLDAYAGPTWTVEDFALVASYLGEGPRGRPRHEVLETFTLGRAGSDPAPADAPRRGR
jgi:2'-5' RNA ligase